MKAFVFVSVLLGVAYARVLPETLFENPCDLDADDYDDCLLQKVQQYWPILAKGIPEAKIPSLEPISVPLLSVDGQSEGINIKMVMRNTTLIGHGSNIFRKFRFDPTSMTVDISCTIPYMRMLTEYYATGRLFVIPLESNSIFDGNFTGIDNDMHLTLKRFERKGVEYLTVDKIIFKGRVETGKIQITSKEPELQLAVNVLQNFFNNNDRLVMDTVNPIYREYAGEFYKNVINNMIKHIPADELIPRK